MQIYRKTGNLRQTPVCADAPGPRTASLLDACRIGLHAMGRFGAPMIGALLLASNPVFAATDGSTPEELKPALQAFEDQDFERALAPLQKAAEKGSAQAQYRLGMMYRFAWGVEKDFVRARQYFEQAAAQENAEAQSELGKMHKDGRGTKRDPALAAQWFERAARNSQGIAQLNLARMYEKGQGVPKNLPLAWSWYSMAISNQYMDAMGRRNQLKGKMTEEQLAKAKQVLANLKAEMGIKK